MDHQRLLELEAKCIQDCPPACVATCPIHMDAKSFVAEMQSGNFAGAMEIYSKTIPFPGIIGRVCEHPCQAACKRGQVGEPVSLAALEKFCVQMHPGYRARISMRPKKGQRVAVVGGGLSGLTAAFDLSVKGYDVVLFDSKARLGGSLCDFAEGVLPQAVIGADTDVLKELGVELKLGAIVGEKFFSTVLLRDYEAIYLGLGKNPGEMLGLEMDRAGQMRIDPVTYSTSRTGVFAAGSMFNGRGYAPMASVAGGRRAAISIDRYLQGVSLTAMRDNEGPFETRLYTNLEDAELLPAVVPADPLKGYTREEAIREAQRCLQCQCLECVQACAYLAHYKGYPKKYLRDINHNLVMVKGNHTANKMINSCSLCSLCEVVCPNGLNMGEVCKEARESMVRRGKMPPSAHDFPLRDMEFSNSGKSALTRHEPGQEGSSYLFFPGCQLGASAPAYVEKTYEYLCSKLSGGVGLMLRCCGAPAEWVGQQEMFDQAVAEIRHRWKGLGEPDFIVACSSCYQVLKNNFPPDKITSLWEIYDQMGLPEGCATENSGTVAVHDACTTRQERHIHEAVRSILKRLNYHVEEFKFSREKTECCGYGGLMCFANPPLAVNVVDRRIQESQADYLTYCVMCRDRFASGGKRTFHLLDLIYGADKDKLAHRKGPGYSQRHENRARLKNKMLREVFKEKVAAPESFESIDLEISDDVKEIMENRLILVEDVQKVIEHAEESGNKLYNEETGRYLAHFRPVAVTYWVVYTRHGNKYRIHNAYSHRMQVSGV